ncbi:MAG: protein BatD [Porphyromonadaceae bacterium]|nr:protein BatD [Porphyromonadaceae bacterium]
MKHFQIILTVFFLTVSYGMKAQGKVEFSASAPSLVYMETPFQLVYTVNASANDLRAPDFQFFEILAGPFQSRNTSWEMINGKTKSSVSLTYTFTLIAGKTGTFKIPPASITVDGEKVYSNGLTIKVEEANKAGAGGRQRPGQIQSGNQPESASSGSSQKVTNESIFVRTIVSKSNIYEQEAILVTYKLYTLLDIAQFTDIRLPDYNGFLKQEIEQPTNKQLSAETYNGRSYGTVVLYQTFLFPQRTGEIVIDKANFTALLRLRNEAQLRSIFDDFFDSYTNVEKTLTAPGARINVNQLPIEGKPASFSGAVGNFEMNTSISTSNLKTNEPATIRVVISGTGNMKLLKNPDLKFPDAFEVYDPKAENQFNTGSGGVSGTKSIEYLFIPRRTGKFEIPSAELSYFDLGDKKYKTLRTPVYIVDVAKGEGGESIVGNYTNKEDVTEIAKDIRYIYTGNVQLVTEKRPLFGTMPFWIMFLLPIVIAGILFVLLRKKLKDNANVNLMKTKRANRIAQKRLKYAQKFLSEGNKQQFYQEVMKAVWTYLSDKLSIPVAELNKENISAKLEETNVDESTITEIQAILNTCEFANYAPNTGQQEMGDIYDRAADAIGVIEQIFKRK